MSFFPPPLVWLSHSVGKLADYVSLMSQFKLHMTVAKKPKTLVVNMLCCAARCQNSKTVQKDLQLPITRQITLLLTLMADRDDWNGNQIKNARFGRAHLVSWRSVILSVVTCRQQFELKSNGVTYEQFNSRLHLSRFSAAKVRAHPQRVCMDTLHGLDL